MDEEIVAPFKEQHYFENQTNIVEGIAIDPVLRDGFYDTENELRDLTELANWWGRVFITTADFGEDSYESYCERMLEFDVDYKLESLEEFTLRRAESEATWNKNLVGGICYSVCCLTGGAWDRPSYLGYCSSLEEALALAKESPLMYQELREDGSLDYPTAMKEAVARAGYDISDLEG